MRKFNFRKELILTEVISVKFGSRSKSYYFDPSGNTLQKGEFVVVETAKGPEYGECVRGNHYVSDSLIVKPLRPIIRTATETDKLNAQHGKEIRGTGRP